MNGNQHWQLFFILPNTTPRSRLGVAVVMKRNSVGAGTRRAASKYLTIADTTVSLLSVNVVRILTCSKMRSTCNSPSDNACLMTSIADHASRRGFAAVGCRCSGVVSVVISLRRVARRLGRPAAPAFGCLLRAVVSVPLSGSQPARSSELLFDASWSLNAFTCLRCQLPLVASCKSPKAGAWVRLRGRYFVTRKSHRCYERLRPPELLPFLSAHFSFCALLSAILKGSVNCSLHSSATCRSPPAVYSLRPFCSS